MIEYFLNRLLFKKTFRSRLYDYYLIYDTRCFKSLLFYNLYIRTQRHVMYWQPIRTYWRNRVKRQLM